MDLRPRTLKALFLEGMRKAHEGDAPDEPDIPETTTPPRPTEPPTVHKPPPAPGRAVEPGYTEWRNGRPWHITPAPAPEPEPKPEPKPEPVDEDDPQDAEDTEVYEVYEGEEGEEWDEGEGKAGRLSRSRPTFRGAVAPSYRPAPYAVRPDPRRSLSEWWWELDPIRRWMLYNGAALGIGFYFHLPQMVTQRTAYVLDTYHSLTDQHVITCYVIAAIVWLFDRVSRRWPFPVALFFRVPLISLVIGFLLNGSHTLPN